jgi:protein import protein ZIM17
MPRRSRQVTFTCNKCGAPRPAHQSAVLPAPPGAKVTRTCAWTGGRTTRKVNPIAWDRGTVFVQCSSCEAWHNIRDEMGLIEEVRYVSDSEQSDSEQSGSEQSEAGGAG